MCEILGISAVHIGRLFSSGDIVGKTDRGEWDVAETVQSYISYKSGGSSIARQQAEETLKLTAARRIAKDIENEATRGRLRPVEEVEAAVIAALSPVSAALDSLPMQIKRDCPELSQRGVEIIERAIAKMRNGLADDDIAETREGGAGEDIARAGPSNGGGVG